MSTSVTSRRAVPLGYSGPAGRDGRIDILRGIGVVFLASEIVVQISSPSVGLFEATSTVSGLAFLVAAEGAVLGMLYRPRLAGGAIGESLLRLWRGARGLYIVAVAVTIAIVALAQVPGLALAPITALSAGVAERGSLLAPPPVDAAGVTLGYPLDANVVLDVVLLRLGPWPLDILVVLSALLLLAPAALWALSRGKWVPLLLVSGALYALELFTQLRILPTRAEASLPILGWQAVFVAGLIAGYYRRGLVTWFRTRTGRVAFTAAAVLGAAIVAAPWLAQAVTGSYYPDVLARIAGPDTRWLFEASAPGPLRTLVAVVMIVVVYGLLTVWWRPLNAALGWLLAAFGRHTAMSIVLLIAAAVVIGNITEVNDVVTPLLVALVVLAIRGAIALREVLAARKVTP